ncbi:hypothetical protein ONZ45_g5877 [Pleurotus djamor]|nr:hypothetical protein ONZ45_g5877 [Pleurotus djamor]
MGAVCCRPQPIDFDGEVNLFHFVLLRCVGKGAFGKVRVVQHKQTRDLYALKYINKSKCVKMKAVPNVIQERRLLEEIDHPFIVNLRYAFQDDENCFFVLDLMLGGDLRFHLERLGSLSEETVRFYVAQLSSALAFLHESKIMHRDLKPDNILLDERGNAHLTDFNIAVHFSDRKLNSVAGSMALYFILDPATNRHRISKDPLKYPEDADKKCSRAGMQVIRGLLERDVTKRFGCKPNGEGFQELRRHPWFKTIDWDTLESKEQVSPFIPDAKKANFDASHELEELLLEDNPLKAKARKANQDNLSAEMRQMEEQFTSYDFKKMQRRSYYPQNQHIVSTVTATSSSGPGLASRPVTPGNHDQRMDGVSINNGHSIDIHNPSLDMHGTATEGELSRKEKLSEEQPIVSEKGYPS